jgi:Domain of unknown function (DUF4386)
MNQDNSWLAPLTGVAFFVLVIVGFAIGGEPPELDEPAREIVDFYVDNKDAAMVGALLEGVAATLFVFFGGYVRRVLRDAEGERGILSAIAFAGTIIFAVGLAIDATITMALTESAEDVDPSAVEALVALFQNDYVPFAVGLQVFLLAMGLVAVRTGAIPKWIGWIAILLAVIAVTPIGFAAFIGGGILVLVLSVILTMRARAAQPRA